MEIIAFFGYITYPCAAAALLLWLGHITYRLYLRWVAEQLTTDRFYLLVIRAGIASMSLLSMLIYLGRSAQARAAAMLLGISSSAWAQNLPKVKLPGAANQNDILGTFTNFAAYGGRILIMLLAVAGICGISWQVISSFVQARNNSDWGRFGATFVTGAVVLIFIIALGQFAWSYLDSLSQL